MVLKKGKKDSNVLFIDATNECIKVTNNNKLTEDNINNIIDYFTTRREVEHVVHVATYDEIVEREYNLAVGTYVVSEDTREVVDIKELNKEIDRIVKKEEVLRSEIEKLIMEMGV